MKPMYLRSIEDNPNAAGPVADATHAMQAAGLAVPQILHLFAYKPDAAVHLERFSQAVMRGPSPLSPGLRELIAAFTSQGNRCPF